MRTTVKGIKLTALTVTIKKGGGIKGEPCKTNIKVKGESKESLVKQI